MSSILDRARKYVDTIPGAVSGEGGHDQTFTVACSLINGWALGEGDALRLLTDYNGRCQPPWTERELAHKIKEACKVAHTKPRGHLIGSIRYRYNDAPSEPPPVAQVAPSPKPAQKTAVKIYDLTQSQEVPSPMPDGCRQFIKAIFRPGEGVGIAQEILNDDKKGIPKGSGTVLLLEDWLKRLDKHGGNPNKIFSSSDKTGAYVRINPMKLGGSKDSDVTDFRHALLEFDKISSKAEQWSLIVQSNIPCVAVTDSGNKSLHAIVDVGAKDRQEFAERTNRLYSHFEAYIEKDADGRALDKVKNNKNPSRFSRLPGMVRGKNHQALLALSIGARSFSEWAAQQEVDGTDHELRPAELRTFDIVNDPDALIGSRWLGKGYSCIWQAPTGIGKSSLTMQAAICWAVGRPFFGITPKRRLKSLIIQHENDTGDVAEVFQGVELGLSLTDEEKRALDENFIVIRERSKVGIDFLGATHRRIDKHHPDLVWLDPLYCMFGGDLSSQRDCSQFFAAMGPITEATGVCWNFIHHTGKPAKDPSKMPKLKGGARSYDGLGSSIIPNWMRAVVSIEEVDTGLYKVMLAKRGKRAEAKTMDGQNTCEIWVAHAEQGICWRQVAEPKAQYTAKGGSNKIEFDAPTFLQTLRGRQVAYGVIIEEIKAFSKCGERKAKDFFKKLDAELTQDEGSKLYSY